jgi:hypothetical protein
MRLTTIVILWIEAGLLLVALPLLIFLGGWAGADQGGIGYGMAMVAGTPATIYAISLAIAVLALRRSRNSLALMFSLLPAAALGALLLIRR